MPPIASPLRVLVVDDDRDVADVTAEVLRIDGHDVRVSYDGSRAVDVANEFAPQVVIVDITMPVLDGFETTARLRGQSRAKNAVFVAHTASARTELSRRADVVFDFYIRKPATFEAYARALEFARKLEANRPEASLGTLGDVLYAKAKTLVLEAEWVALVRSAAMGHQAALHALYERSHRPVFTLLVRLLTDRERAEESTLDVFEDVWRAARSYDPAVETVLGWIMNQARSRALRRLRFDRRKEHVHTEFEDPLSVTGAGHPREDIGHSEQDEAELLSPSASLKERLARRIAPETRGDAALPLPLRLWSEPEWEEVSQGIFCKLLAADPEKHRISMLVRLLPGIAYPAHTHAEFEELHLLDGELWIDERKLHAGDYNRAQAPSGDKRVWSETGCTCVLVTSTLDVLT